MDEEVKKKFDGRRAIIMFDGQVIGVVKDVKFVTYDSECGADLVYQLQMAESIKYIPIEFEVSGEWKK